MPAAKDGPSDPERFDISDVTFDVRQAGARGRRQVILTATSETDFNLIKWYLALKAYVEEMGTHIGMLDEAEGDH